MKKIVLALLCLISTAAFAQENTVDVIMDGKPAKMNIKTGAFTFTDGVSSSNMVNNIIANSNIASGNIHTVNKGETLYSISKKHEISMAQIKSLNNLETNVLSLNQQLIIGYNATAQITGNSVHIVAKGNTLYQIARDANLSVQELKQLNNLDNTIISIGQKLKIK